MSKIFIKKSMFLFLIVLFNISGAYAETNICRDTGIAFVFFNGVNTTPLGASRAKEELKRIHGKKSSDGDEIRYEVLYNYTDGFDDFVETFEQRLREQEGILEGRFELFFEVIRGSGSWWDKIIDSISETAGILKSIFDLYQISVIKLVTSMYSNPPTISNYVEHQARIDNWILEGKKLLFVAHSQGNLFANSAYSYAIAKTNSDSLKLVHIAPASPSLNGNHTLADLDLVINGLRLAGSVPSITDNIPGYLLRPAGANGQKDILGHGLIEIYINQSLSISNRVKNHINTALNSLVAPEVKATSGFFTATLTWNGSGDVDLHTIEPNGSHVYYSNSRGTSGYLDVDNTVANGPEHYYASCESDSLQTGSYSIRVANYSAADGKTARVQIASWNDGVLGTKSVILGGETRDNPAYTLFNVSISKDEVSGKYSVSISQ